MVATLEQERQGLDISSVSDHEPETQRDDRMYYPSTPKEFRTFDKLKHLEYDGMMLTAEERSALYWDHAKSTCRNG